MKTYFQMFEWYNRTHKMNGSKLETWRDWLQRVGYARDFMSGDYGKFGIEVGLHPVYHPNVVLYLSHTTYFYYFLMLNHGHTRGGDQPIGGGFPRLYFRLDSFSQWEELKDYETAWRWIWEKKHSNEVQELDSHPIRYWDLPHNIKNSYNRYRFTSAQYRSEQQSIATYLLDRYRDQTSAST